MIALQEELDWECYRLYGLIDEDLTYACGAAADSRFGQRAFEIVLARQDGVGELQTTWFERHRCDTAHRTARRVAARLSRLVRAPDRGHRDEPEHRA